MVWYTAVVKYGIKKKLIYNADPATAGWLGGLALSKEVQFGSVNYTSVPRLIINATNPTSNARTPRPSSNNNADGASITNNVATPFAHIIPNVSAINKAKSPADRF